MHMGLGGKLNLTRIEGGWLTALKALEQKEWKLKQTTVWI